MQLKFLVPKDKIKILDDIEVSDTQHWKNEKIKLSKDTLLEVSQIYIRKNGSNSITFKVIAGEDFYSKKLKKRKLEKVEKLKDLLKHGELTLEEMKKHNCNIIFYQSDSNKRKYANIKDEKNFTFPWNYDQATLFKNQIEKYLKKHKQEIKDILSGVYDKHFINCIKSSVIRIPLEDVEQMNVDLI